MRVSRIVIAASSASFCVLLVSTTGNANPSPSPIVSVQQEDDEWIEFGSDINGDGVADDRDGDGKPDLFWAQAKWIGVCTARLTWCAHTADVVCLGRTVFECVQTHPYRRAQ
jgi:hypothetical protein